MHDMTIEQLEARLSDLETSSENLEERSTDEIEADMNEYREIIAELERRRQAAAEAAAHREQLANTSATTITRDFKENNHMDINEIRSGLAYNQAFIRGMKINDYTECRALLSDNVSGGNIPVPTQLETEIKNAWETYGLVALVKHSYFKGNVKIGFELSATGATVHVEGTDAPDEEILTLGTVELKAESIKKWITVSDESIDGTSVDTVSYLYTELAQRIAEKAEEILVGKITTAPTTSTKTACAVAEYPTQAPAIDTVVNAVALLSAQARDLHIAINRQSYAALKATALNNKWGADPFDGLKDRVVFTDKLPAYSAASTGNTWMIIGDFGYGAQANFPAGNEMTIKYDDLSLAEKDLVKLVGRQYVGMGVVAPMAFVRVTK